MTRKDSSKSAQAGRYSLLLESLESRTLLSGFPVRTVDAIGDSFRDAYALEADAGGDASFSSIIDNSRDQDVFVFTAAGCGVLQIDMITPESSLDSYLYVYDSTGRPVAKDDDSGDDTDSRVSLNVQAGELYYIRADAYGKSTGSYTLLIDGPAEGATYVDDFGDSFSEASTITIDANGGAGQAGEIGWYQDQDMFVFTAIGAGTMQIDMATPDSALDSYLYIYDENMAQIVWDDDSGDGTDAQVVFEVKAGCRYYIQADAWRNSTGTYSLELTGPTAAEVEPDDEPGDGDTDDDDIIVDESDGLVEGWAVLIGAWDYYGQENDLYECATDVAMMQSVLIETYGFTTDTIHAITGGEDEISVSVINEEFAWLQSNADGDDVVYFYYTGHGSCGDRIYANDNEALALPNGEYYTEAAMGMQLEEFADGTTRIVVLDTCYSGGFANLGNTLSNTCVLASSSYNQSSWGQVTEFLPAGSAGSVFTSWLTRAMQDDGGLNVDTNQNGRVSMAEAFVYADSNIRSRTRGRNYQDPVMSSETSEFEIILAAI